MPDLIPERVTLLEPIGPVFSGCLCCPPKPGAASLDWHPHPGFGMLVLTCDGEAPDWWWEFCVWPTEPDYHDGEWRSDLDVRGRPFEWFSGGFDHWSLDEAVTMREIEEAVAADPDHDWRLRVEGPMGGVVYQRHGCGQWLAVERLEGFA